MPRITRAQQKIFAENASNNGVFGSLQSNDPVTSSDPATIQSRAAFGNGWNDATYSAELLPPLEEFQAIQYVVTRQLAYLLQEGIPEWDTNTTYYKGSMVKVVSGDTYTLFESIIDNNTGNLTSDTTKWKVCGVSEDFNTGMHYWRADVTYGLGDWVRGVDANGNPDIFQSLQANNKGNNVTNFAYWSALGVGKNGFPLLSSIFYDHELNEANWLRADTWSWQDGTVYTSAYQALATAQSTGVQSSDLWKNYNIIGSLTDNNAVLSGFTSANYAKLPNAFNPNTADSWEINLKIKTPASANTQEQDLFNSMNGTGDFGIHVQLLNGNKPKLFLSSNGTNWDLANAVVSANTLSLDTDYYIKVVFDGSSYVYYTSTTGEFSGEEVAQITITSSTKLYSGMNATYIGVNGAYPSTGGFWGSIDMKGCSFKYDNSFIWKGGISVPYTRATNGWKIVDAANAGYVQDMYDSTGRGWYYIIDTDNTRFKLPRSTHGELVESVESGKNGYRIYSDGWCEQWGETSTFTNTAANSGETKYVYLQKEYANTDYNVIAVLCGDTNTSGYATRTVMARSGNKTTGYFGIDEWTTGAAGGLGCFATWKTCGYITTPPDSEEKYLYFYVGNTVRNQTEVDVGEITEALAKKWDSSNMQVVTALPENPQTGVFYFVK